MGSVPHVSTATTDVRATDLRTPRDVARRFVRTGSGQALIPVVAALVVVRLVAGEWGPGDLVVLGAVVVLTGFVEWVLHLYVLHASPDAWTATRLGLGAGHRRHHLDPPDLQWLLLRGPEALVFLAVLVVFSTLWTTPLVLLVGGEWWPSVLTAWTLTAAGVLHYEWTHLLVHTAHRPRTRFYARLARNHRRHHFRNERYWLGVTSNLGDRVLGTLPRSTADVPLSGTARTLGADAD